MIAYPELHGTVNASLWLSVACTSLRLGTVVRYREIRLANMAFATADVSLLSGDERRLRVVAAYSLASSRK